MANIYIYIYIYIYKEFHRCMLENNLNEHKIRDIVNKLKLNKSGER